MIEAQSNRRGNSQQQQQQQQKKKKKKKKKKRTTLRWEAQKKKKKRTTVRDAKRRRRRRSSSLLMWPLERRLMALLKACAQQKDLSKGTSLHSDICKRGFPEKDIYVANSLINMYAKCGALAEAQRVLVRLPSRDVFCWTSLIIGYTQHGQGMEALKSFNEMQTEGHFPHAVTFASALRACACIGAVEEGEKIHNEISRRGLLQGDVVLGNALVDMYAKCGVMGKAQGVMDELPVRDVVSWNALIAGYAQHGQGEEVLKCFDKVRCEGHSPDAVTFTCTLKACAEIGALVKGEQIHDEIIRLGFLQRDIVLGTAVVDMYAKCGAMGKAQGVFDELPLRDVVSWNALIAGYAQHGQSEEVLKCFNKMRCEGHSPSAVTFICALKACADIGALFKGEQIHVEIVGLGFLQRDVVLGNALVDMYAKCGAFGKAQGVLGELSVRNAVSWNALIAGYTQHGQSGNVLACFEQMQHEDLSPDRITFLCVLNACSHSGLLDEGQMYFTKMSTEYGIGPDVQHYCCMVDLFGRAGEFGKALAIIKMMPSCDDHPVWMTLLGACRKWKNVKLGRLAFNHAIRIDKNDAAAYVCMANIYTAAGMKKDADEIEAMCVANKAGCSWWIDANGKNSFLLSWGCKVSTQQTH